VNCTQLSSSVSVSLVNTSKSCLYWLPTYPSC